MELQPPSIPGESRDWTFVLEGGCSECGWEPTPDVGRLREALQRALGAWPALLAGPDTAVRPAPTVWSPIEYGSHVRDMARLLGLRVASMLEADDPQFANWDGDVANVVRRDWDADPAVLIRDIARAGAEVEEQLDRLEPGDEARPGHRGNGVPFTVLSLLQFVEHDISHHVADVRRGSAPA